MSPTEVIKIKEIQAPTELRKTEVVCLPAVDMPLRIEIIKVPYGQAPEWVKEAEVGLVLTVVEVPENSFFSQSYATELLGYRRIVEAESYSYGYNVLTTEFIQKLEAKDAKAAQWFKENVDPKETPWLIFRKEECQIL